MKSTSKRSEELVKEIANVLLARGLSSASLRPLAEAIGTSDRMLLYYFRNKDELIEVSLKHLAARLAAELGTMPVQRMSAEALQAQLLHLTQQEGFAPFMRLWLEIASMAARGDQLLEGVGYEIAQSFLAWIEEHLDVAPGPDRKRMARTILRTIEGEIVLGSLGV